MTVYSDALNNKFLGNCKWGNHDINYSTANYPKFVSERVWYTDWYQDMIDLFSAASYTNISSIVPTSRNGSGEWRATPPDVSSEYFYYGQNSYNLTTLGISNKLIKTGHYHFYENGYGSPGIDYAACINSKSLALQTLTVSDNRSNTLSASARFTYMGKLEDVNNNFNYYSAGVINHCILIYLYMNNNLSFSSASLVGIDSSRSKQSHYIVSAQKELLQTGDAIYPIACSNGATPTGQWATDMYVFDNNPDLGYPCIGRVPNMLLGVGTFTYLKPVELITAPDAGSNLWLPVGSWGGSRTLLMRCYSE